jgi:hypothetical protein
VFPCIVAASEPAQIVDTRQDGGLPGLTNPIPKSHPMLTAVAAGAHTCIGTRIECIERRELDVEGLCKPRLLRDRRTAVALAPEPTWYLPGTA